MRLQRPIPVILLTSLTALAAGIAGAGRPLGISHAETGHLPSCQPNATSLLDSVGNLPDSVELVVAIDDAATLRAAQAGAPLAAMLRDIGALATTEAAWADLANAMGLEPGTAFDSLLGSRAIVVARNVGDPANRQWAVLSEIAPRTEAKLRSTLKPALRGIVEGRQLLALENGRFELTVDRCESSPRAGAKRATLIFAASEDRELFDALLVARANPVKGRSLRDGPAWAATDRLGSPQVLVAVNLPAGSWPVQGEAKSRGGTMVLGLTIDRLECKASLVASPSLVGLDDDARVPRWSAEPFKSLWPDALAVTMEWCGSSPFVGIPMNWPSLVGHREKLEQLIRGRTLMAVRVVEDPASRPIAAAAKDQRLSRRLSVTLAAESPDVSALAAEGDAAIAALVPFIGQAAVATTGSRPVGPDFAGIEPEAVRVVPVPSVGGHDVHQALGAAPSLAWAYGAGCRETMTPPQAVPVGDDAAPCDPGWWIVSLSPCGPGTGQCREVRQVRDALSAEDPGPDARRLISTGVLHPGAFIDWLGPERVPSHIGFLRWIESLDWELAIDEGGPVTGTMEVRLGAPPAK